MPTKTKCPAGLIDVSKWPQYFMSDSFDRGIFDCEGTCATPDQVLTLLSDAEYYAHPSGPDMCPAGLIPSAKATVKRCRAALAAFHGDAWMADRDAKIAERELANRAHQASLWR